MDDSSSMSSSTLRLKPKGKSDPANRASSRKHADQSASRPVTVLSDSRLIQTLSSKDSVPLVINPPEVRFDNVESDVRYVMTISVQNNTTTAQRIRFQSPKTSYFTINYIPSGAIAPGLDTRAEIECQLPENLDEFLVSDSIVVLMGPHRVEVPLYARLPCPDILFDPFLNLGLVVENQSVAPSVIFENRGAMAGRLTFKRQDHSQLTIDPTHLELAPHSKAPVTIRFEGKAAGPVRELVQVHVEGVRTPMTLDVGGSVVPQKLSLLSAKGGVLEEVDFGTIFFGQEREIEALLINNGPQQVNYSILFPEDTAAAAAASDASTGTGGTAPASTEPAFERCVSIHPSDGTLNPFSQIVLKIKFQPIAPTPEKGFSSKYIEELAEPIYLGARAVIDAFDMNQSVPLAISANAVMPTYKLSPTMLRFGECPVYDRRDILMTLVNTSPIPLNYDFSKVAQFKITPSSGSLGPAQTKSIVASFTPAQLGEIKKAVQFSVEGGLRGGEIRLFGVSSPSDAKKVLIGGVDKVPEDFKTNFKFVDPVVVARELTALHQTGYKREAPWESTVFEPSNSWDEIYESTVKGRVPGPPRFVNNDNPTYSLQQLQKRSEHKQQYNDFLQQSHAQRIQKRDKMAKMKATKRGLADRSDFDGVDMGMERGLDDGPVPKLPPANEPLWLANGNKQSEGGHSFLFDEDRLIVKKQKEGPSTQAELRDCSSELTPDELRRVTYSHKILNFGKVCVNSVNVKNFAVTNELQHNVIVKLGTLELELRQSKPISQIAPPSSMIGFDMTFVCREVCKYKKSFSYTINDIHNFKVTVLAEVVPIELVLDKKELKMEFSEHSLDRSHVEKVAVSNPGNAVAEYMWSNAGAFKCTPEQGTIAPGGAMVTTVTWTPTPTISSNTEELGLLVTGGTQQSLLVTGVLPEAKLAFEEKKLTLGTIAVGDEKSYIVRIKNVGTNPAVFHFEEPSPNTYITIKQMRGKVPAGEIFEVDVIVHPKAATSFDNKTLTASVRGGKNIGVKLFGDAIVPKVELAQKAFQFGSVVTGSRVRMPFTLTNSSSIDATMTLDLNNCADIRPTFDTSDAMDEVSGPLEEDNHGNAILQLENTSNYKITLKPNTTCAAFLAFSPTAEKSVNFRMPLYLKGITDDKSFVRQITGEALKSRLKVSSYVVDFADRVVSRDPASRMTYFKEITFKNIDNVGLSYEIREVPDAAPAVAKKTKEGEVASPVFFVSPMQCNLSPGESNAIRVTFLPQSHGDFSKVLEIYVENQPDPTRPYFTVTCKGSGVYPRLTFSRPSLVLPTVPLSVPSRTTCQVINMGYDNIELKYRVSPVIPIPITVQFPEGAELGLTRDKVPIIITAKAESPVSWSGKIEFYDNDGEKFYLEISGCADNCLFVNYPFVGNYVDRYGFVALDDQPIRLATKNQIVVLKSLEIKQKAHQRKLKAAEASAKEGDSPKKGLKKMPSLDVMEAGKHVDEDEDEGVDPLRPDMDAARLDADITLLLKWMNAFICRKPFDISPGRFPETITDVHGDNIIECIEQMSGKKIPAVPPAKAEEEPVGGNSNLMNKLAAIGKITAKYKNLLLFLIKSGALLLHISPIQLLGHDECLLSREMDLKRDEGGRLTVAMLKERRSIWSAEWRKNCHAGWSQILFQAFKTYILSRITYHEYENTPGVVVQSSVMETTEKKDDKKKKKKKESGPKAPPELQASNVYSHSESVLLAWAAYHFQRAGRLVDEGGLSSNVNPRMPSLNRRIVDLQQEFFDFFAFCQIVHSHLPDAALTGGPLCGYSYTDSVAKEKNFNRMKNALSMARMDFDESMPEITSSARGMMLLLVHMFLNLPSLVPKTTIEFKGTLGMPIVKTIELKNPSKKRVAYDVTLEGASEFTIGANSAVLSPLSETDFVVTCVPHFSKAAKARLTFWGVREGGTGGTNIVFDLVSNVTDRRPQGSIKRNVALFETEKFEIAVTNPFEKQCTFPVVLVQTHTPTSGQQQNAAAAKSQRNKSVIGSNQAMAALLSEVSGTSGAAPKPKTDEDDAKKIFKEPFWCAETSITLGPHESGKLNLQAVPFSVGTYNCQIVLMEPTVGEFAYEVIMTATPPNPIDSLSFQCNQGTSGVAIQKILKIASANSHFEHAVAHVIDSRLPLNKRGKAKQALLAMFASPISNEETGQSQFAIEMSSPYFNVQKEFGLVAGGIATGGSVTGRPGSTNQKKYHKVAKCAVEPYVPPDGASQAMINAVPFSFFAEKPGVYKTRAVIYSLTNNLDMRVLDLCATVTPSETSMTLEFHGAARQKITQEIPIHNESENDWNLTSIVNGPGFSAPKTIFVAKGDKVMFPVSFAGPYSGQFKGTLILRNLQSDKDSFEFQLKGVADDPLAEQHLKFKCKARNRQTFSIHIPAVPSAPPAAATGRDTKSASQPRVAMTQLYSVETDLPYVSGEPQVEIGSNGGDYEFSVFCPIGGVMSGSITFADIHSNQMIWYTVDIDVTSPAAESTIEVQSEVRKAVVVEITLDNPTKENLEFQVSINGDGLLGDSSYTLTPSGSNMSSGAYELIYSPLIPGKSVGSISFVNDRIGEFWYRVSLEALPAQPTVLDTIECMVGSTATVQVPVENPLPEPVSFEVHLSDKHHFSVYPENVHLGPYAQATFDLSFHPSSLSEEAHSDVILSHPSLGDTTYKVTGMGLLPGIMPPIQIFSAMKEISSHTILFRNPFSHPLPVDIILHDKTSTQSPRHGETPESGSVFSLLLRKSTGIVLSPESSIQVGLSFSPERLGEYHALAEFRSTVQGRNLIWCYPIIGLAEAGVPQKLPKMVTPCKSSLLKEVEIALFGLKRRDFEEGAELSLNDLSCEIVVHDKQYKSLVNRAFRIQPVALGIVEGNPQLDYCVRYRLLFEPLKVFTGDVEIIVACKNKGRWKADITLEAEEPPPDDILRLCAPVGGVDRVSFRLTNRFLGYSPLQAYFTARSSPHFSVSPSSGVLAPFGSAEGTQFVVTFSPKEYGMREVAYLVVSTDEAQWNYEIHGSYPEFNVKNIAIKSKIDSRR